MNELAQNYLTIGQQRIHLLRLFQIGTVVFILWIYIIIQTDSLLTISGAILIFFSALLPSYLWCSGKTFGMPIFPVFAITFVWTHGIPMITNNPGAILYSEEEHFSASIVVSVSLLIGTSVWYRWTKIKTQPKSKLLIIEESKAKSLSFAMIVLNVIFWEALNRGWILFVGYLYLSTISQVVLSIQMFSTFILSYLWGTQKLSKNERYVFFIFLTLSLLQQAASLLLVGALSLFLLAIIGFTLGRQKMPYLFAILCLIPMAILHYGKAEMRGEAREGKLDDRVTFFEFYDFYIKWIYYSLNYFEDSASREHSTKQNFLERLSLVQWLLLAQRKSPTEIPYLQGATYFNIPRLFIPRIFDPNKPPSKEGTDLLNIHYGIQTHEGVLTTSIGWGIMNEAYANFGFMGCLLLGGIVGIFYGWVTSFAIDAPLLSFRFLFGVTIMFLAFHAESNAGIHLTVIFQRTIVLVCLIGFAHIFKISKIQ